MQKLIKMVICLASCLLPALSFGGVLFQENFDDANFASRGWYDATGGTISTTEHIPGSIGSYECRFSTGAKVCNGGTHRHLFTPSDSVYVSYWIKYSANWQGQPPSYDHHEFHLMTNKNRAWDGIAYTHLTGYIEQHHGVPILLIQDGQNIDETRIGQNLVNITENRSLAGCNGDSDGYGNGSCYQSGSVHWNGKGWQAAGVYFSDSPGPTYKNNWHHVEAYFKLNSIVNGKGIADGIIQYWYDGKLIVNHNNVMMRTGLYPDMRFNQFLIAPYMGGGSPVDQTLWIDNLTIATAPPSASPSAPANLSVK